MLSITRFLPLIQHPVRITAVLSNPAIRHAASTRASFFPEGTRQKSTKATKSKGKVRSQVEADGSRPENDEALRRELSFFRETIESRDHDAILSTFTRLPGLGQYLGVTDVRAVAQSILRISRHALKDPDRYQELATHALQVFVQRYKSGLMPPTTLVLYPILMAHKCLGQSEKGISFFNWMVQEQRHIVLLADYGGLLELVAPTRNIAECEDLFKQAISTKHNTSTPYLLTPNAVLTRPEDPVFVAGLSQGLLRAIVYARLLKGQTNDAYLGLDTAIKLFPSQSHLGFLELWLDYRPIAEALEVCRILCRSGNKPLGATVTRLLAKCFEHRKVTSDHGEAALLTVEGLRHLIFANAELNEKHMSIVLLAAMGSVPPLSTIPKSSRKKAEELASKIASLTVQIFKSIDVFPGADCALSFAKAGRNIENSALLVRGSLAYVESNADITQKQIGNLIVPFADIGNEEQLTTVWTVIRKRILESGKNFPWTWFYLARAASRLGKPNLFSDILRDDDGMSPAEKEEISSKVSALTRKTAKTRTQKLPSKTLKPAVQVSQQLENIAEILRSGNWRNAYDVPTIFENYYQPWENDWYTRLYHDLHIEPLSRPNGADAGTDSIQDSTSKEVVSNQSPDQGSDRTSLGQHAELERSEINDVVSIEAQQSSSISGSLPLEVLREKNWVDITNLMLSHEAALLGKQLLSSRAKDNNGRDNEGSVSNTQQNRPDWKTEVELGSQIQREDCPSEAAWRKKVMHLRYQDST